MTDMKFNDGTNCCHAASMERETPCGAAAVLRTLTDAELHAVSGSGWNRVKNNPSFNALPVLPQ